MSDKIPDTTLCSLDIQDSVATVTLSRSEVFNALNTQLITELVEIFDWTSTRSASINKSINDENGVPFLRVLVLNSEGKHFCAGADVNMMRDAGAATPQENLSLIHISEPTRQP